MAKVTWFWESDDGSEFKPFSAAYSRMVEAAYAKDPKQTWPCKMRGNDYAFDFAKMVQTNTETGSKRRIRREGGAAAAAAAAPAAAAAASSSKPGYWEWQDDSLAWKKFDAPVAALLEEKHSAGATEVKTKVRGWDYHFDFTAMTQKNLGTGTERNIRRTAGPAPKAPAAAAAAAKSAAAAAAAKKRKAEEECAGAPAAKSAVSPAAGKSSAEKIVKKGRGVVDKYSGLVDKGHILEEGKDVWMCTLNQTNLGENNNKFYIIQVIEDDKTGKWWTWNRWGRVGAVGMSKLQEFGDKESAKADFRKKFRDKTKNDWSARESFVKHSGKYQLMDIDYGEDKGAAGAAAAAAAAGGKIPDCTLPPRVRAVMELIADTKGMTDLMKELDIDVKKMPLGNISKKQVKEAFLQLKKIETELAKPKPNHTTLLEASSQFYTLIPHDVGYSKLSAISTKAQLEKKMEMLDVMADLEIAARVLGEAAKMKEHPLDAAYSKLNTKLKPLPKGAVWDAINQMVKTTHGKTHNSYSLSVTDIFEVERPGEAARYAKFAHNHNRALLWHGSRVTNWMGILSQGLRIAPPEAPVTGYMFGKGVYFADCVSKSANYCHCGHGKDTGFLMLSEVALGDMHELYGAKKLDKAPGSTLSAKGMGKFAPTKFDHTPAHDHGTHWPLGPMGDAPLTSPSTLLYNEYIVYDVSQIRSRYLVKVQFHFK
eukprot:TRINITY_DN14234_c0_g1_i1.p1 TRINITY_DN14234_c0_g1~~TRINITY_DN14234_c0_g1_i1.p1  ORF type:complete len:707 (+),score=245.90 TRINITY_DN14234_c0_g1_i1:106-2226(+)